MPEVEVRAEGSILRLHLNRPYKKNAVTTAMYAALADGLAALEDDDGLRVGLFTASGGDFCAGNDLYDFAAPEPGAAEGDPLAVTRFLTGLATASKPLVAAVRGKAVGVGSTLLLHCDFVYVARDADLRFPFVDLGLVPEAASTLLLPEIAGLRRATEALLLAKPIDAETAAECGIATSMVDSEELEARALETASAVASKPARSIRETRRLLRGEPARLIARQEAEGRIFAELLRGPDFAAALERFGSRSGPGRTGSSRTGPEGTGS